MERMKTIEVNAGSELANEMYEFQIGDIAHVTHKLMEAAKDQIEGWEEPLKKDEYDKIIDMIEDIGDFGVDKLIVLGMLAISLGMSFIANIEHLALQVDIESADKEDWQC